MPDLKLPRAIEIWSVDLVASVPALTARDAAMQVLPDEDRQRFARIADPLQRAERLAAHVALRLLIERARGPRARALPFARLASGKPVLDGHDLDFSLSHIDGFALIALAHGGTATIGIDVERLRPVAIEAARRHAIECAAEHAADAPLPALGSEHRFQQAWTRLEALAKARGVGMARVLAEIGVVGAAWRDGATREAAFAATGPAIQAEVAEVGGAPSRASLGSGYAIADLALSGADLVAAVAVAGEVPPRIAVRAFPADALLPVKGH